MYLVIEQNNVIDLLNSNTKINHCTQESYFEQKRLVDVDLSIDYFNIFFKQTNQILEIDG